MPVTLRKRLQCHYCGKRLNTARRNGAKIKCDHCLADNFFDADDNVVDVPVEEVARAGGHAPAAEVASESSIFCTTCLKNQYLYTTALSEYLPDDEDPNYAELEAALPQYERELDLRYPRCCHQCEPKVQAQLQRANYAAKSDHLQRMMKRSRYTRASPSQYLRRCLISAAGVGQVMSLLTQLYWHALSSQANSDHIILGITPQQCFTQYPVPAQCTEYASTWLSYSLAVALICIWWNPKWQHRLAGREGRLVGLSRYYKLQLAILVLRFVAWILAGDFPAMTQYAPAIHTMAFLTLAIVSLYAWFGIVQIDKTPLVDWNKPQPPLVVKDQYQPPVQQHSASPLPSEPTRRFPIEALAGPSEPSYEAWQPPTPPLEDDNMDWTPATHEFNPRPRFQKPKLDQKSPFYGTLPAKPVRGSLNPRAPPPPPQKTALGLPPGFFGLSKSRDPTNNETTRSPARDAFAPPRFFANERQSDTGLENLFNTMFSVQDSRETAKQSTSTAQSRPQTDIFGRSVPAFDGAGNTLQRLGDDHARQPPVRMLLSCSIMASLAIVLSGLVSTVSEGDKTALPCSILPYTAVIPALHTVEELVYTYDLSPSSLILRTVELSFAGASYFMLPKSGSEYTTLWNKLVIGTVCLYLLKEIYNFCQLQSSPPTVSSVVTHYMTQSIQRAEQDQPQSHQPYQPPSTDHDVLTKTPQKPRTHKNPAPTPLRNRDSDESINSVTSINTTSTASGWKTPRDPGRTIDWQTRRGGSGTSNVISNGLGGLSLGNDFGTGAGITGPRSRQAQSGAFRRQY